MAKYVAIVELAFYVSDEDFDPSLCERDNVYDAVKGHIPPDAEIEELKFWEKVSG